MESSRKLVEGVIKPMKNLQIFISLIMHMDEKVSFKVEEYDTVVAVLCSH